MSTETRGRLSTYSFEAAAARVPVSVNHLRNLYARDELPFPIIKLGRVLKIPIEPFEKWLRGEVEARQREAG